MSGHAPTIVVRAAGVVAGYGVRPVLRDLDLEVRRGELLAVVGANGSGKTTLLGVLAGTLSPSAGTVELLGRPLSTWSRGEVARRVAVLPQLSELPAGFRVSEAVGLGRIPHGTSWFADGPEDERAVAAALRDADAADLADRGVSQLSGGERQRVLVAMALAQEPHLLLLDEPTLHLDLAHQLGLLRTLARLRRTRDLTVVAVLHDLNLAAGAADRVVLLEGGRLATVAEGGRAPDLTTLARAFGVAIDEAHTADGRRVLAPAVVVGDSDSPE